MKRIVVVEDVVEWQDYIEEVLLARTGVRAEFVGTEEDFRSSFKKFEAAPPDLFVLDCMLPWTTTTLSMGGAPSDVTKGTFHQAGIRCQRMLSQSLTLARTPSIFWTVLSQDDLRKDLQGELPTNSYYVAKTELDELADLAIRLIEGRS